MEIFDAIVADGYEQVVFGHDRETGLRAIIAIHDTTLGPALGGVRMRPYRSEEEALTDVLNLARAMTYKFAAAGIALGGGKSVVIGDPATEKSDALLQAFGRLVSRLGGHYIPGIDMGTTQDDLRTIGSEAGVVSCTGEDPSPFTALGVYAAIRACLEHKYGSPDLDGVRVAVQGVGHVGEPLARRLASEGAEVVVSDVDGERAARVAAGIGCSVVEPDAVLAAPVDVLSPCATGGVIDDDSLAALKCAVVAGGANNVLADRRHAQALRDAGIVYAPDYVANAGGVTLLDVEHKGEPLERAHERCLELGDRMRDILRRADDEGITTLEAADRIAEARLEAARRGRGKEGS